MNCCLVSNRNGRAFVENLLARECCNTRFTLATVGTYHPRSQSRHQGDNEPNPSSPFGMTGETDQPLHVPKTRQANVNRSPPNHSYLRIPKTWPSMSTRFNEKLLHGSPLWSRKQKLSSVAVVEFNFAGSFAFLEELGFSLKISTTIEEDA